MVEQVNDTNIQSAPALSVVVPVHNEVENIEPLIAEIMATLEGVERYEIIYINDCSRDSTLERLTSLDQKFKVLRVLTHQKRSGQSAAIRTGVKAARGDLIATLDGDGQNDPEDIPKLLKAYREQAVADARILIAGFRARRQDSFIKRLSSKIANGIRSSLLGDATPDTGCGLKIFRREDFFDLPGFDHMHRFLPALMIRNGGQVISVEVSHRPREHGKSKYGTLGRLWVGIMDLIGVLWLKRRPINPSVNSHVEENK